MKLDDLFSSPGPPSEVCIRISEKFQMTGSRPCGRLLYETSETVPDCNRAHGLRSSFLSSH